MFPIPIILIFFCFLFDFWITSIWQIFLRYRFFRQLSSAVVFERIIDNRIHATFLKSAQMVITWFEKPNHLLLMPADWCRTHWCRSHWCRSLFMPMKHFWCQSRLMPVTFEAEEALLMPVTIDAHHFWCQSLFMPVAVDALSHYWCQSLLMSVLSNRNIARLT